MLADAQPSCYVMARPPSVFHGEADFDGHLPVIHLSLGDTAARFDHLEPAQVLDRFVRALNGPGNSVFDGSGGGAGEFDEFIDVVFHGLFFLLVCALQWQMFCAGEMGSFRRTGHPEYRVSPAERVGIICR